MWIISAFLIHCIILTVYIFVAQSGNIDIFEPIIRSSPEVNVTKEDLFGYKVVLHQIGSQGGISNTRLVPRPIFSLRLQYNDTEAYLFIFILEL